MRTARKPVDVAAQHILNARPNSMKAKATAQATNATTMRRTRSGADYFPEALGRQQFYDPPSAASSVEIRKRLEYWAKLRRERSGR